MKGLHKFLKVLIFIQLGACALRTFAIYNDYTRHRELYAMYSAPWYTDIIITVTLTAIMILMTTIAYCVIGHIIKKRNQEKTSNETIK